MNKTDLVINVPDDTLFADMSQELQAVINALHSEWPSFPMLSTHSTNGRKLIYCRLDSVTKEQMEQMIATFSLDWILFMVRQLDLRYSIATTEYLANKTAFLPYIDEIIIGSDMETIVTRPAALSDPFYIASYAGTEPLLIL